MLHYLLLYSCTLLRQMPTVFLRASMASTSFCNRCSSGHSPLCVNLCKVAMQLLHLGTVFIFVLSCKELLERKTSILNRQKSTVYMRVQFIAVYNESSDILFSIFFADKGINILCPFLYVLTSLNVAIICPMLEVHLLGTIRKFVHTLS